MKVLAVLFLCTIYCCEATYFSLRSRRWLFTEQAGQSFSHYLASAPSDAAQVQPTDLLADLWHCVLLLFGANHFVLLLHEKQIWRLLSCSLLHASVSHLGFNCLMLWIYMRSFTRQGWTFLVLLVLCSNLLSAYLSPFSIIVGSSTLCFSLWTFRISELLQTQIERVFLHLIFLILVLISPMADTTSHLMPIFFTLLYTSVGERGRKGLVVGLGVTFLVGVTLIMLSWAGEDVLVGAATELGCVM